MLSLQQNLITVQVDGHSVQINIRENPRSSRLSMKWHPVHCQVQLIKPLKASMDDIQRFLKKSEGWLKKINVTENKKHNFCDGAEIPIFGQIYKLVYHYAEKPKIIHGENVLNIYGFDPIIIPGMVKDWLRNYIYQFVCELSHELAARVGKQVGTITVKDVHTRWGSCSSTGNLTYSWRLVFAPQEVTEYVCAHEVAHLIEMNHSPAFWKIVESLCPDYKNLKQWLKAKGKSLFLYG